MEEKKAISALRFRAEQLRIAESNAAKSKAEEARKELNAALEEKMAQFKIGFAEVLPMLDEEGITYAAYRNNDNYAHLGHYIQFQKGDRTLNMDFSNSKSYRYEHSTGQGGNYGTATFSDWSMDQFILWITEHLLDKDKPDPTPQQRVSDIAGNYEAFFLNKAWSIGHPPTLSFPNLLWSILVGQVYKDRLVCLAPNLSGQFEGSVSIVVVEANLAGHEPVNVLFDPKYSMDEAWEVLDEINEQLWEVSSPQLSRYIVTTSMAAELKQPTQQEFEGDDYFVSHSSSVTLPDAPDDRKEEWRKVLGLNFKSEATGWMDKWKDKILAHLDTSPHCLKLKLDDGQKDDVIAVCFKYYTMERYTEEGLKGAIEEAADFVVESDPKVLQKIRG